MCAGQNKKRHLQHHRARRHFTQREVAVGACSGLSRRALDLDDRADETLLCDAVNDLSANATGLGGEWCGEDSQEREDGTYVST